MGRREPEFWNSSCVVCTGRSRFVRTRFIRNWGQYKVCSKPYLKLSRVVVNVQFEIWLIHHFSLSFLFIYLCGLSVTHLYQDAPLCPGGCSLDLFNPCTSWLPFPSVYPQVVVVGLFPSSEACFFCPRNSTVTTLNPSKKNLLRWRKRKQCWRDEGRIVYAKEKVTNAISSREFRKKNWLYCCSYQPVQMCWIPIISTVKTKAELGFFFLLFPTRKGFSLRYPIDTLCQSTKDESPRILENTQEQMFSVV